ncbi:glycosyltransferase family 76 protein, partial [Lentithecium fluviatile CBS 122367]
MLAMPERVEQSQQWQKKHLIVLFLAWKCLLLVIAACSPGPGYDTSALILSDSSPHRHIHFVNWPWINRLALNLFRWDALYFVKSARQGYVYEQEWAFSRVYSATLESFVKCFSRNPDPPLLHFVWAGAAVSNISHLFSVLTLFKLLNIPLSNMHGGNVPFIACVLHILSPAGLFLSAPYSEALFAALNFSGMLSYVQARVAANASKSWTLRQDLGILGSAVFFGMATWIRGNGLLSGLIYLFDVVSFLPSTSMTHLRPNHVRRIAATFLAGIILGTMSIVPQYIAYQTYCDASLGSEARPWCHRTVPSIYTWVQSEYWNVGFLRYWTLPNLPLFLMAAPMLWLLFKSSVTYLRSSAQPSEIARVLRTSGKQTNKVPDTVICDFPQLALPQLVLAIAAATSFHVQIINRISSGYPMWYLSVAEWMTAPNTKPDKGWRGTTSQFVVRGMVVYAIVQGVLFAGFLPPA